MQAWWVSCPESVSRREVLMMPTDGADLKPSLEICPRPWGTAWLQATIPFPVAAFLSSSSNKNNCEEPSLHTMRPEKSAKGSFVSFCITAQFSLCPCLAPHALRGVFPRHCSITPALKPPSHVCCLRTQPGTFLPPEPRNSIRRERRIICSRAHFTSKIFASGILCFLKWKRTATRRF